RRVTGAPAGPAYRCGRCWSWSTTSPPTADSGLAGGLAALVELAHPLGIADQRRVVHGDAVAVAPRPGRLHAGHPASGPPPVVRDQHHRHLSDRGLRLQERLHTPAGPSELLQVGEVVGPLLTRTRDRTPTEPGHRNPPVVGGHQWRLGLEPTRVTRTRHSRA